MPLASRSVLCIALALFVFAGSGSAVAQEEDAPRVLVFTATNGWRHASIPAGIAAVRDLGAAHGIGVAATEDSTQFHPDTLARYDAVVFLNTSGDVLDEAGQAALQAFVESGGGFVGVHAASDTEYEWPWYGDLVGAYFADHPEQQTATVVVADSTHPSTAGLPTRWERFDEWYNFQSSPADVRVLARLDESTYEGGTMGGDHPIAWSHAVGAGRAWYTALGHTAESYAEPLFRQHLLGGLLWTLGRSDG